MNIKELIEAEKKKGISLREIARRSGVSMGTIQNILIGDTETRRSSLEKLARYFGKPIEPSLLPPSPDAPTLRDILNLQEAMRILTREMGTEIGKLKEQVIRIQERMLDASTSKDISRLYFRGDEKEVFKN